LTAAQVIPVGIVAELEAWRDQLGPREWAVVLDVVGRWLERERSERALRRWAS